MPYGDQIMAVQPLRVVLDRFRPSKSQRRVLRRNADLLTSVGPTVLNDDLRQMFEAHAQRFKVNVPPNLETFLGLQPDTVPCENVTLAVHSGERLVAASFLDLGKDAVSSVYGIFDPAKSGRSLGIFTMLKEIEYAAEHGYRMYYHGYACEEPSPYDYKKRFGGLEFYDWKGNWRPFVEAKT